MSSQESASREFGRTMGKLVVYIVLYLVVSVMINYGISLLPQLGLRQATDYTTHVNILVALAFGYLIVSGFSNTVYWSMRTRYEQSTAAAVKNVFKIIGIGAMLAAIAGGVAGGAAGVALGGFIGLVIGFASQQVLGQAIAGLFILIVRPFRIADSVVIAGEEGIVEDVTTLFTTIVKQDGTKALIPNNSLMGSKIILKPKK